MRADDHGAPLALRVRDLGKSYPFYERPSERVMELLFRRPPARRFDALREVSFDLARGRTLGVVGDNGAGKSTLLQLIAGAATPTRGRVEREGKILGLLELGIGFHPEFTGRENVFFYGDILGLPRREVAAYFPRILAFSELGEFIDKPLKTYSTGMRMRLAFSLVASLEPDILIVDEALAVGDIHFQKKCIDRMTALKEAGCTIIFCSHSTYQISMFCDEVMWLKQGRLHRYGTVDEVIPAYEHYQNQKAATRRASGDARPATRPARISRVDVLPPPPLTTGGEVAFAIAVETSDPGLPYHLTLSLKMEDERGIFVTGTHLRGDPPLRGARQVRVTFPDWPLLGGSYIVHARVFDDKGLMIYDEHRLEDVQVSKSTREMGVCKIPCIWERGT